MAKSDKIIQELIAAYWKELETVQNYLSTSQNLDGVLAEEIKKSLEADITAELGHAQQLAKRIRILGGTVPGSMQFKAQQKSLQPTKDSCDVISVINGVIEAEEDAIKQYKKIIKLCEGKDYGTQDLAVKLLADEEGHLREFVGFSKEFDGKKR
jgi:bacterioferritin